MLKSLYIRDYALIDELEVEFERGLNIITGETGAGKSILVGALKMILGERASTESVRSGARKAVVEGIFEDIDLEHVAPLLEEAGIDLGPSLILRREITGTQSRAFINDTPATVQIQRAVAGLLVDLHGQHEHQSLLRADTHVNLLDDFGGLAGLRTAYSEARVAVMELVKERKALAEREADLSRERERLSFELEEIDAIGPQAGEEEALEAEHRVLENAERLHESSSELFSILYESDAAVYDRLTMARNALQDLERIDSSFAEALGEIRSAQIVVGEVATFLQEYSARIEFNPARLEEIRDRLGDLDRLKRRYGGTVDSVIAYRADIAAKYELASDFAGALGRLDQEIREKKSMLTEAAVRLSEKRQEGSVRLAKAIVEELRGLGMEDGRFEVDLSPQEESGGWITLADGRQVAALEHGMDQVTFFISTNRGEPPKPLAQVASGGEVSRIMLAMKSILAKSDRLPILVFDEIDVGVSGAIAQRVGERMRNLAGFHQILTITHLPQVAALGHAHFRVEKAQKDERAATEIKRLSPSESEREIATLMSGDQITDAALRSARQLMSAAG